MSKTLFLLRGVPGAGKSSLARRFCIAYSVCEADEFMYDENGEYKFSHDKLVEAHAKCQEKCERLMKRNWHPIAVANVFSQEWELDPYIEMAKRYDYEVISLIVENRHGNKNTHGCPDEDVQRMIDRFQIKL